MLWIIEIPRIVPSWQFLRREAIAEVLKAILRLVCKVPILISDIFQHMKPVDTSSRMQSNDWSVSCAVLEPTTAWCRPCGSLHELCGMYVEISDGCGLRSDGFDALSLDLLHEVDEILGVVLDDGQD